MTALPRRRLLAALTATGALAAAGLGPAAAQSTAGTRLIVGYAAGGPVDAFARIFAPALAKELGGNVIVENKPGASGALAGEATATAAPDGLTLWFAASPTITIAPNIQKKMRLDPTKDVVPLVPLLTYANVLVVPKDSPYKSLGDVLAYAKSHPGKVFFGSAGVGASNHLSGELMAHMAKVEMTHVPYKGNAPAMNDVIGGQLQMMFDIVGGAKKYIDAGQVRPLAVTSATRNAMLPEVPTMREVGLPGYEVNGWYALYAPPKLPAAVAEKIVAATRRVQASADFQQRLAQLGYTAWTGTGADVASHAAKERAMWATVTKGIEID